MRSGQVDAMSNLDPVITLLQRSGDLRIVSILATHGHVDHIAGAEELARRARGTPRIAIRLLQRVKELDPTIFTKSGIMVGRGEERVRQEEVKRARLAGKFRKKRRLAG